MRILLLLSLCSAVLSTRFLQSCVMKVLSPSETSDLGLSSVDVYNTLLTSYDLLPSEIQIQLKACSIPISDELKQCEHKYGYDSCEECGLLIVPKCKIGFQRIDCGSCARRCPQHTIPVAAGMLCEKSQAKVRESYTNLGACQQIHQHCEEMQADFVLSACPEHFRPLGNFHCLVQCPNGFEDEGDYCRPEFVENYDFTFDELF